MNTFRNVYKMKYFHQEICWKYQKFKCKTGVFQRHISHQQSQNLKQQQRRCQYQHHKQKQYNQIWQEVLDDTKYQEMINKEIQNSTQFRNDLPYLYKRILDSSICIEMNSERGRELLKSSLGGKYGNIFHTLAPQFITQYNALFCGPSSLVMVLNALSVDPGREWKYPWRWYDENMLNTCKSMEHTSLNGCSLDSIICMARCNQLSIQGVRASLEWNMNDFREDVKRSCSSFDQPIIANFCRNVFNQTGTGHFSPIGAYEETADMVLVMETARFKYPPFWVKLDLMWDAMRCIAVNARGVSSGHPRGYLILRKAHGSDPIITLKLPWENMKIHFQSLSAENIHKYHVIKTLRKEWNNWLETEYFSESKSAETLLGDSLERICIIATHIQKSTIYNTDNKGEAFRKIISFVNDQKLKQTCAYQEISKKIKTLTDKDLKNLQKILLCMADLVTLGQEDDIASPLKSKQEKIYEESFVTTSNINNNNNGEVVKIQHDDEDIERISWWLTVIILFWPYQNFHQQHLHHSSIGTELEKRVANDLATFPNDFSSSLTQQIQFVDSVIQHIGHEKLYVHKKDN